MRVVSLLPSATEMLCHIGGREMLVGVSHECDEPTSVKGLPVLTAGRTHFDSSRGPQTAAAKVDQEVRAAMAANTPLYTLDAELLTDLRSDVILTQDLCRVCSIDLHTVDRIAAKLTPIPKIVSCEGQTVEAVMDDMLKIGHAVGLERAATEHVTTLRERFYHLSDYANAFTEGPSVAFLEWTNPLFVGGHWIPQLIERAGGRHPLNETVALRQAGAAAGPIGTTLRAAGKSVTVPPEVLIASRPEYIVVCPCGLSLDDAVKCARELALEPWWRDLPAVRRGNVAVVDGNRMFARPGPKLADAFAFLVGWLNNRPELIPQDFPFVLLEAM